MLFFCQLRNKDIAALAGVSENHVAVIKHRSLKQISAQVACLLPVTLQIPYTKMQLLELPRRTGRLIDTTYEADHVLAHAEVDEPTLARLREYVIAET